MCILKFFHWLIVLRVLRSIQSFPIHIGYVPSTESRQRKIELKLCDTIEK
ncbi:hypothetical protein KP509_23G056900 [Ceratopteris richardii]|uniref:Uncharacterized protein n=1 Tax=Ceratopteris richardii TaxID=49495 RepID=A0A8T2S2A7_CERRI|nr:hypothetical protein KP509_23G056900 [Ceratopteris richardii]